MPGPVPASSAEHIGEIPSNDFADPEGRGVRVGLISKPAMTKVAQYSEHIDELTDPSW